MQKSTSKNIRSATHDGLIITGDLLEANEQTQKKRKREKIQGRRKTFEWNILDRERVESKAFSIAPSEETTICKIKTSSDDSAVYT